MRWRQSFAIEQICVNGKSSSITKPKSMEMSSRNVT